MNLKFIKLCFVSAILGFGTIFPIILVMSYANPWSEAIGIAKENYPNNYWIPIAYSSTTQASASHTLSYKALDVVIFPENKTLSFGQKNKEEIQYAEQEGGLLGFLVGTIILYSLYFWILPRSIRDLKKWMKGKSRYA